MNGIIACFTGHIGKDCEVRTTRDGKPWLSFNAAVDASGDESVCIGVAVFGEEVPALAARLIKGTQVYVEGKLRLGTWVGRDGEVKGRLNVTAWTVCNPWGRSGGGSPRPGKRCHSMTSSKSRGAFQ